MEDLQVANPEISVVMPVYNQEKYLAKAVESVLYQTFENWELIIYDDGSTDKSREIIMDYAEIPKVKIIVCDENMGISFALNTSLEAALGKYYVLCAPDDYMGLHALEMLHSLIEGVPQAVAIYTPSYVIDENGELIEGEIIGTETFDPRGPCTVNGASAIVRMEALRKLKEKDGYIYDPKLKSSMDWDLWIRLSKLGAVMLGIGEPLTYYRRHRQMMSVSKEHRDAVNEVSRRLAFNVYRLPNPSLTTISFFE